MLYIQVNKKASNTTRSYKQNGVHNKSTNAYMDIFFKLMNTATWYNKSGAVIQPNEHAFEAELVISR